MRRNHILLLAVIVLALVVPFLTAEKASEDLLALWLAAMSLSQGTPELVYSSGAVPFTMQPPEAWIPLAEGLGHEGNIFPYLYPPLWAALFAPLTGMVSFATLEIAASLINPLLLLATSWLAWRATRSRLPCVVFLLIGQGLFYATLVGGIAILQNQPQILVACLTVLAVERGRSGAQITAGAVLALAAAIKLYPLLFVPILLARGQYRGVVSLLLIGGALGLGSVALAGWPLHAEFLEGVAAISATAIRIPANFGVDALVTSLLPPGSMQAVQAVSFPQSAGSNWFVMAKPDGWLLAGRGGILLVVLALPLVAARLPEARVCDTLWPVALIIVAMLSPLAWCYYYIAPLAFAPDLVARMGARRGGVLLLGIALAMSRLALMAGPHIGANAVSALAVAAMLTLLAGFVLAPHPEPAGVSRAPT
ncbi:glycosyltransferase family 87 protein [Tropicimonas sp. TH_r6]|uniref:glycosyltransferase family 87 protein n=1 Tax=Tropicimonas sp. TH_r6 TaxID=3082085 RepID=UPI00295344C6|nr:glycosyltransferase family 87 protein [Tropicimonas sp. TH_r6]MDV7144816.1 glycosyltransferase family 87 protein [Tropicimonas sp. TH_r6]